MKKTLFLLSILANTLFAFLLLFDLLIIARIFGELATHGLSGVKGWILHVGSVGRITGESIGPGVVTFHFPSTGPIYREFFTMCGVLILLTALSFWIGRIFGRKARQAS
jgi:hypothetical protein